MSQYRDLIARMAVDAEFAAYARAHSDEVSTQYGLTLDETQQLRGLADAAASAGPTALGARLSKSGISTGLLAGFVVGQPEIVEVNDTYKPAIEPQTSLGEQPTGTPEPTPGSGGGSGGGGGFGHLEAILGNQDLEALEGHFEPPKPEIELPGHIGPIDALGLPEFPEPERPEPMGPPYDDWGNPPVPPPADPGAPPAPAPPADPGAPPAPQADPVSQPSATPAVPAIPVTDVTNPLAGGVGGGEPIEPLQVGAPTTDTPGGTATPPSAFTATGDSAGDSGIGATEIAIGGAGLVAGAVAGGVAGAVAGKSLGSSAAGPDDEQTMQGLGPATA